MKIQQSVIKATGRFTGTQVLGHREKRNGIWLLTVILEKLKFKLEPLKLTSETQC